MGIISWDNGSYDCPNTLQRQWAGQIQEKTPPSSPLGGARGSTFILPVLLLLIFSQLTTLLAKFTAGIGMVAFSPSFQFQDKKHFIYFQERRRSKDVGFWMFATTCPPFLEVTRTLFDWNSNSSHHWGKLSSFRSMLSAAFLPRGSASVTSRETNPFSKWREDSEPKEVNDLMTAEVGRWQSCTPTCMQKLGCFGGQ